MRIGRESYGRLRHFVSLTECLLSISVLADAVGLEIPPLIQKLSEEVTIARPFQDWYPSGHRGTTTQIVSQATGRLGRV